MNVYEVTSKNITKCSSCRKDINKLNSFYMFTFAQNKNNGVTIYLCKECKNKLKNILNAQ